MSREHPSYSHIGRKENEVDPAFWSGRYQCGETGWDHGEASPGLVDFLHTHLMVVGQPLLRPSTFLVPGCGRGHDARALAHAGFDVTGLDVVLRAVEDARRLAGAEGLTSIRFEPGNFFDVPLDLRGPYDWIFEHTFFCAIDPEQRDRYVETAADLLKPGGYLLGVFYNIQPESGPPFGATREELLERFTPMFTLQYECVPRSFESRKGKELLMLWVKT